MSGPATDGLLGPAEVRKLLARLDVRPTKQLGQNFLHDPNTIRRIVRTAELTEDDVVLEVGPGLGSLTLGPARGGTPGGRGRARPGAGRRAARDRGGSAARPRRPAGRGARRRAADHLDRGPAADRAGGEPAVQRGRAGRAAPARAAAEPAVRAGHGAVGGGRSARRAAGVPHVRGAEREGGLVRGRAPGGAGAQGGVLAGAERGLGAGAAGAPGSAAGRRRARGSAKVFAVIDAAFAQRRKTLRAALGGWAGSPARAEELLHAAGIDHRTRGEALDVAAFARIIAATTA